MELEILRENKLKIFSTFSTHYLKVESPIQPKDFCMHLGVDPGTKNLGIAIVDATIGVPEVKLWQIELERKDNAIERMLDVRSILASIMVTYYHSVVAVIEGASYADRYRQVELAEQRASIALWCVSEGHEVQIVPPNTIRKNVFGNGRTKAQDVWTNIPPDVANALACCYFS